MESPPPIFLGGEGWGGRGGGVGGGGQTILSDLGGL